MLPYWAWILIALGGAGLIILLVSLSWRSFCGRKTIRTASFEADVFEVEKNRAKYTLAEIRKANQNGIELFQHHNHEQLHQTPGMVAGQGYISNASPGAPVGLMSSSPPVHIQYQNGSYAPTPQQYVQTNIRMAQTFEEIPSGPAPQAPPGFVTIPMVLESRRISS